MIQKIQKRFLRNRFYKCLDKYRTTVLQLIAKTNKFDEMTGLLCDKKLLQYTHVFLNRYFRAILSDKFINNKCFLSVFLITKYPKEVLGTGNIDKDLLNLSEELVNSFQLLINKNESLRLFNKYLLLYASVFDLWKKVDSNNIINMLLDQYIMTEEVIDDIKKSKKYDPDNQKNCIDYLEKQKLDLQKKADSIGKVDLNSYHKLHEKLTVQMKKYYWEKMMADIKIKKYDLLEKNLLEIRDKICALLPNRPDLSEEIKSKFDIELIMQMIQNDAFSLETFIAYCDYAIDTIISLHSADKIAEENENWLQLKQNITESNYLELFPNILIQMSRMIDDINDRILLLDFMNKNNIKII